MSTFRIPAIQSAVRFDTTGKTATTRPPTGASRPAAPSASTSHPHSNLRKKITAEKGLRHIQKNGPISRKLEALYERRRADETANRRAKGLEPIPAEGVEEAVFLSNVFQDLMLELQGEGENGDDMLIACRDVIASLQIDIEMLQRGLPAGQAEPDEDADSHSHVHAHAHVNQTEHVHAHPDLHEHHEQNHHAHAGGHAHHHHDGRLNKLLKKFLGVSDIDEAPHAVVGAKAGIGNITSSGEEEHLSKLEVFQHHSLPQSGGELAGDLVLSGVMGGAGALAYFAGRGEKLEAQHQRVDLKAEKKSLSEQIPAFQDAIESLRAQTPSAPPAERNALLHKMALLEKRLPLLQLRQQQVDFKLMHIGKKIWVGRGSQTAGAAMMAKGLAIDPLAKLLGHLDVAAPIMASITGFAGLFLSPLAAGAGLVMGWNSRQHARAELGEYRRNLHQAMEQLGVQADKLPPDIREEYDRFFVHGKWESGEQHLASFKKLMNWFVTGMAGYTGAMTGLSIVKIVSLIAGGAVVADLAVSGGILTATGAVLIGTYGFLRYHAQLHEKEEWAESDHPEFNRDLILGMISQGGTDGIDLAIQLRSLIEDKDTRRQDFLFGFAQDSGLRYDDLRSHSTNPQEVKDRRREQRIQQASAKSSRATREEPSQGVAVAEEAEVQPASSNAVRRYFRNHGYTRRNMGALGKAAAGFATHSAGVGTAFDSARADLRKAADKKREAADKKNAASREAPAAELDTARHDPSEAAPQEPASKRKTFAAQWGKLTAPVESEAKRLTSPVGRGTELVGKTVAKVFSPGWREAKRVFGDKTDFLTKTQSAALFDSPEKHAGMVEYMLEDVDAQLKHLDLELERMIDYYDFDPEEFSASTHESAGPDSDPAGRRAPPPSETPARRVSGTASTAGSPAVSKAEDPVDDYLRGIGMALFRAKLVHLQGCELMDKLQAWKDRSADERGPNIAEIQARFLAFHQNKVYDPAAPHDGSAGKRLSKYLMTTARDNYHASRHRVAHGLMNAAPIMKARSASEWQDEKSSSGAPQIGMPDYLRKAALRSEAGVPACDAE